MIQAKQTLLSKLLMKVPSEGGAEQCVEEGKVWGGGQLTRHARRQEWGEKGRG